jgi:RnfABCDGE-type electron transport complex D subunit
MKEVESLKDMYNVSASPHIRSSVTTAKIMRDVALALIPASIFGVYQFGFSAFLILLVSVTTCVVSEFLYGRLMKLPKKPYECSALVTGLLLGMNLPATVPIWMPMIGGVFAIVVVKMLYGGLGQNFMNPALAARCFLAISFAGRMTTFTVESFTASNASSKTAHLFNYGAAGVDGVSGATPLAALKAGEATGSLLDLFIGFKGGVIGETSALMILIGALYLVIRKIISLRIPLTYIGSFAVFIAVFGGNGLDTTFILTHILGGGLLLGAFFMATDYVTCPITPMGQIIYGLCLGCLTAIFRLWGNSAEGVSYAIIFCNLLVPLIEKISIPRAFGVGGKKHAK